VTRTTPIPTPQETPNASPLNTQAAAAEAAAAAKSAAAKAAAATAETVAAAVGNANRNHSANPPPPTPAAAAAPPPSRTSEGAVCGVGLVLVPDRAGALVVSSVTEGGPAARTNLVRRGDVLKQIDGVDVYTWPMARVRPLIVGSAGSIVTLGMQVTFNARSHTQRLRQSF
jgi:nucleoid-associated protein YgaU